MESRLSSEQEIINNSDSDGEERNALTAATPVDSIQNVNSSPTMTQNTCPQQKPHF